MLFSILTVVETNDVPLRVYAGDPGESRTRKVDGRDGTFIQEKAVEGLEEMIVVVDREYRYVLANRAFLNYRGMEREELLACLIHES